MDADNVQTAAEELTRAGFTLVHEARVQPWGQTVARLQSSEGMIIGISTRPRCTRSPLTDPLFPPTRSDRHHRVFADI